MKDDFIQNRREAKTKQTKTGRGGEETQQEGAPPAVDIGGPAPEVGGHHLPQEEGARHEPDPVPAQDKGSQLGCISPDP